MLNEASERPAPNAELIKQAKLFLELAQQGKITTGVVLGVGPDSNHYGFSLQHEAASVLMGEYQLLGHAIQMQIIGQRAQQQMQRRPNLVVPRILS